MSIANIITVVGARPQFIKAAVVSRAIAKNNLVQEKIIHTGQHFDANMSDVFFDELAIPTPHFNLGIGGGTHGQNTGRMLEKIEEVLINEKPSMVLVYGDTDSTLAGTLAAVKLHIPVAHVEAGLRSFNRKMPEEINRVLTDHASNLLFTPTKIAANNLLKEGIDQNKIIETGDVMFDAALFYGAQTNNNVSLFTQLNITPKKYALVTLHRAENVDNENRLAAILAGLKHFSGTIILPLHPRTKNKLLHFGITIPDNIHIVEPVGYLDMILLEKNALFIATDSGGVQKEAYFHKVPCITLRDETEWIELVQQKANIIAGANSEKIIAALQEVTNIDETIFNEPLYGKGHTGEKIVQSIAQFFES